MKRVFFSLFAWFLLSVYVSAAPISESEAREKAKKFLLSKKGESYARSSLRLGGSGGMGAALTVAEARKEFYVFSMDSDGGYVIVSGDDRMPDVLGYSYSGTYNKEEIPPNMRSWLEGYTEQYEHLQRDSDEEKVFVNSVKGDEISPMIDCRWNQSGPYNDLCPVIDGTKALTGCVATAMAQVMYYHKWPRQTTREIPEYTTKTNKIAMPKIEVTTIDWNNMMPAYSSKYTEVQKKAVSNLMLLCGNAVKMDYDLYGSGAACNPRVFADYFGYNGMSISQVFRSSFSYAVWSQMIYDELKGSRPVIYSGYTSYGAGHTFVIDGYDSNDYFHVNWGWGGYQNGYFLLSVLNDFNSNQNAIIGIEKADIAEKEKGLRRTKTPYALLQDDVLTYYYDDKYDRRPGKILSWNRSNTDSNKELDKDSDKDSEEFRYEVSYVVFDPSCADYKYLKSTRSMFSGFSNLISVKGLEYLVTENVTDMGNMFYNCYNMTYVDVSKLDTRNVTDMSGMFYNCFNLTSLDVSNFNTQKVKYMRAMFYKCSSLKDIDISNFNMLNVTDDMISMFENCFSLKSLTFGNGITSIGDFTLYGCTNLTSVTIPSSVTSIRSNAFACCYKLKDVYCYSEKVPNTLGDIFSNTYIKADTLHVPKASIRDYKAASPWNGFGNVVASDVKSVPAGLRGDVNGDGEVGMQDVVFIVNYIINGKYPDEEIYIK